MQWYEKFKVGQQVKVVKRVGCWVFPRPHGGGCNWTSDMDETVGKVYKIVEIDKFVGYRLDTQISDIYYPDDAEKYDYYYPVESLAGVGGQLVFSFYNIK